MGHIGKKLTFGRIGRICLLPRFFQFFYIPHSFRQILNIDNISDNIAIMIFDLADHKVAGNLIDMADSILAVMRFVERKDRVIS